MSDQHKTGIVLASIMDGIDSVVSVCAGLQSRRSELSLRHTVDLRNSLLLAKQCVRQEQYLEAEALYYQALSVIEARGYSRTITAGVCLHRIARIHAMHNRITRAESMFYQAIGVYELAADENGRLLELALYDLAELYQNRQSYLPAIVALKRALTLLSKRKSVSPIRLASLRGKLSSLLVSSRVG